MTDAEAVGLQLASRRSVERRKMLGNGGAAGEIWVHQGSTRGPARERWGPAARSPTPDEPVSKRTARGLAGHIPATSESDPSSTSNRTSKNPAHKHLQWVRSKHRHFDGLSTEGRDTECKTTAMSFCPLQNILCFSPPSHPSLQHTAARINASTPQLLGYA